MENNIYENIFNQNILPKYGHFRDIIYDRHLTEENQYPHNYSINDRIIMTDVISITIDPPGCKDADDAFSVFYKNDKLFLAIHIADPTEIINLNSELWSNIKENVITHYPSNREPIHLMPEGIIELASLTVTNSYSNTELKNAISIITEIDQTTYLPINNVKLEFTKIQVNKSYTFSYFDDLSQVNEVQLGLKISDALKNQRSLKTVGTKLSDISTIYTVFNDNNIELNVDTKVVISLKQMIAEFAIFANSFVGEYLKINLDGKGIFRTCDTKNLIEQNTNLTGQGLLNQIIDKGISAEYLSTINSHDLVGTPVYCHFTSPIRRLADCICHYLIRCIKLSKDIPWSNQQLDNFARICYTKTKKQRNIQYNDTKFRFIQLLDSYLNNFAIDLGFRITGYTGLFLNCIINKLYLDNKEYDIQISYTLRIPNATSNVTLPYTSKVTISNVNPPINYDEGAIPDLDNYLHNLIN